MKKAIARDLRKENLILKNEIGSLLKYYFTLLLQTQADEGMYKNRGHPIGDWRQSTRRSSCNVVQTFSPEDSYDLLSLYLVRHGLRYKIVSCVSSAQSRRLIVDSLPVLNCYSC
jgi:hypothetical protein